MGGDLDPHPKSQPEELGPETKHSDAEVAGGGSADDAGVDGGDNACCSASVVYPLSVVWLGAVGGGATYLPLEINTPRQHKVTCIPNSSWKEFVDVGLGVDVCV